MPLNKSAEEEEDETGGSAVKRAGTNQFTDNMEDDNDEDYIIYVFHFKSSA